MFLGFFAKKSAFYFKNTKNTAIIRQENAAKWFHWSVCPLNITVTRTVNTVSDITSWMIFSCIRLKGPPFSTKPILFAGTWAQYSKNATPQENRMTRMRGQLEEIFISCSLRWPYQANVIKTLDAMSSNIVQIAFIDISLVAAKVILNL